MKAPSLSPDRHSEWSRPIFFFPVRSCGPVGLCREESLVDLDFVGSAFRGGPI
jgi:hypothetical protein